MSSSEARVSVRFWTRTFPLSTPDTPIAVPLSFARFALSELVNHLLGLGIHPVPHEDDPENEARVISSQRTPFDFLVDDHVLTTTLGRYVETHGLSTESVLDLEYTPAIRPPKAERRISQGDWVGAVSGSVQDVLVSGCYDQRVRGYHPVDGSLLFTSVALGGPVTSLSLLSTSPSSSPSSSSTSSSTTHSHIWAVALKECDFYAYSMRSVRLHKVDSPADPNLAAWIPIARFSGHNDAVSVVAAHPTQSRIASGCLDGKIGLWSLPDSSVIDPNPDTNTTVSSSSKSSSRLARKRAKTGSTISPTPVVTDGDFLDKHREGVSALDWLDDSLLATISLDHTVQVHDMSTGATIFSRTGESAGLCISHFSNEPRVLLSGQSDPFVRVWDTRVGDGPAVKSSLSGHSNWISSIRTCPGSDHLFLTGSYDRSVRLWDIRSTHALAVLEQAHKDRVFAVDWYGRSKFVTGGADDALRIFSSGY